MAAFEELLQLAWMVSQKSATDKTALNSFRARLPSRLQDQAMLVTSDFDVLVGTVSRLSSAQQIFFRENSMGSGPTLRLLIFGSSGRQGAQRRPTINNPRSGTCEVYKLPKDE